MTKEEEFEYLLENNIEVESDDILRLIQCGLTDFYNCRNQFLSHYEIIELEQISINEDYIIFEVLYIEDKETGEEINLTELRK